MRQEYKFLRNVEVNTCGIYKIVSPNGEVYIGQSKKMRNRWRSYGSLKTTGRKIDLSILNFGIKNHRFYLIHELPKDIDNKLLIAYEQLYMDFYNNCGVSLLNEKGKGESGKYYREKMKGRLGIWMKGRKPTQSVIDKRAETKNRNNKPLSQGFIDQSHKSRLGEKNPRSKINEQIAIEIVRLREVEKKLLSEIANIFNLSISGVSNVLRGHRWSHITNIKRAA